MPKPCVSRLSVCSVALASLTLAAGAAMLTAAVPAQAAAACGSVYPYSGFGGKTDPNGFYAPDMRSYVGACVNASGRDFAHTEKGPNGQTGTFGSPGTWDNTASALGFGISSSPSVGAVAQLHSGEDATLYGEDGKPNGTLTGGDVVGYVDAVYSGAQALVRTYDSSSHQIRSFRMVAKRYLLFNGGQGIRNGVISTPKPSASATTKPSASPKPSVKPSPSATASHSATPTPTASSGGSSAQPSASPTSTSTPADLGVTNKKSKTLAAKYGKAIGLGGVIVALLLGAVVVAAARRTDDTGD